MPSWTSMEQEPHDAGGRFDWLVLLPLLIIVAGLAAWASSFGGVFLFDDRLHVIGERRLEALWPLWEALARRRPVVDYSIAINYALGGEDASGYHAVNVGVHILAALTLYGIVRRTLLCEPLRARWEHAAPWFALVVALIWVVHPLQTQSVTYIIQRSESAMGSFYLLTLYCVIRGVGSSRSTNWFVAAVVSCALGMGSKAVMVTAPVVVLLYDRAFLSRSLAEIVRRRWGLYVGLAATWGVLWVCGVAPAVLDPSHTRSNVGFGYTGVTPLEYAQTQFGVLLHYLRLSLWPHPLCLDYHWPAARTLAAIVLPAIVILALVVGTIWAVVRKPRLGFVGAWFFIILAPTSSFVPIKDPIFEHRMYLSLAAVVVLVVLLVHLGLRHVATRFTFGDWSRRSVAATLVLVVVTALSYGTVRRNQVYHSEVAMWRDVLAKQPGSPRATENLGTALLAAEQMEEAAEVLREAARLKPKVARVHNALGVAVVSLGGLDEATEAFRRAVELQPDFPRARRNLGKALASKGELDEAIQHFEAALEFNPRDNDTRLEYANTLLAQGDLDEAVEQYVEILKLDDTDVSAWTNLGTAVLNRVQRDAARSQGAIDRASLDQAIEAFGAALQLNPNAANAHNSLGIALAIKGEFDTAIEAFRRALLLKPDFASAHYNLANCLVEKGDNEGAARQLVAALRTRPNDPNTHFDLGVLMAKEGSLDAAIKAFRTTLRLNPDHARAREALDAALAKQQGSSPG